MRSYRDIMQRDIAAGVVGGIAGSLLMTDAMAMAKKQGIIPETLPHRVERKLAARAGMDELSE